MNRVHSLTSPKMFRSHTRFRNQSETTVLPGSLSSENPQNAPTTRVHQPAHQVPTTALTFVRGS